MCSKYWSFLWYFLLLWNVVVGSFGRYVELAWVDLFDTVVVVFVEIEVAGLLEILDKEQVKIWY